MALETTGNQNIVESRAERVQSFVEGHPYTGSISSINERARAMLHSTLNGKSYLLLCGSPYGVRLEHGFSASQAGDASSLMIRKPPFSRAKHPFWADSFLD